eukprot:5713734-Prymnesium_polylepis.1
MCERQTDIRRTASQQITSQRITDGQRSDIQPRQTEIADSPLTDIQTDSSDRAGQPGRLGLVSNLA